MLLDRQPVEKHVVLRAQAQALADGGHVCQDALAVHVARAGRGREQPRQDGHGGGFAGAVVAEKSGDLVLKDVQRQTVDCHFGAGRALGQKENRSDKIWCGVPSSATGPD